ncbi:hypothetical protein LINPERHAP2_LOCUS19539 [Linum perenne]
MCMKRYTCACFDGNLSCDAKLLVCEAMLNRIYVS